MPDFPSPHVCPAVIATDNEGLSVVIGPKIPYFTAYVYRCSKGLSVPNGVPVNEATASGSLPKTTAGS